MVPNTADYVVGVYNPRGDIIPIVDLRRLLHLPAVEQTPRVIGNLIILELDELTLGVAVDRIDSVVGVPSAKIQSGHPLFADINLRFIGGVVECQGRLYIILDAERAFAVPEPTPTGAAALTVAAAASPGSVGTPATSPETELSVIREGLKTFAGFHVTEINQEWVRQRLPTWREERAAVECGIQIENGPDAEAFLTGFVSTNPDALWSNERAGMLAATLANSIRGEGENRALHGVNVGCGHATKHIRQLRRWPRRVRGDAFVSGRKTPI